MSIKDGNTNLAGLFSDNNYFRIPDYQRGYAWGKTQLEDFWEDLENAKGHKHYTGVLSLEKAKDDDEIKKWQNSNDKIPNDSDVYYIVDGQQRLTTSIILIKVLLNSIIEQNKDKDDEIWLDDKLKADDAIKLYIHKEGRGGIIYYCFGYTFDNPSYEFLKVKIFEDKSSSNYDEKSIYTKNLKDAKTFFEKKIKSLKDDEKIAIFKTLTENFIFNVYKISEDFDVYVAFETMNNRGAIIKPRAS